MVSYNKTKKELLIKDNNDIKDLIKSLPKEILSIDLTGAIKIQVPNIILEKDSTLLLDNGRFLIITDKFICKDNSHLILGSDEKDSIFTKVSFNINNITTSSSSNITFKNVIVESNQDWYLGSDENSNGIVSIINSEINFKICTNDNLIVKNLKLNEFMASNRNIVVHDVNIKNKFDSEYLLEPNGDITFYNGVLDNYSKLLDTDLLSKDIRLVFKGTELKCGYEFNKNKCLDIIHDLIFAGKVYNKSGVLSSNTELEVVDRYNNVVQVITTDEEGNFDTWLPYYTYLNDTIKYHMPLYIKDKDNRIPISIKENKKDVIIHIGNNIDKELLLLIERVDNKLGNGLNEIKTGLANLMFNSEKPIKNVSSLSVVSEKGTRLTIN